MCPVYSVNYVTGLHLILAFSRKGRRNLGGKIVEEAKPFVGLSS
jgi:hypothetical protein